MSTSLRHTWLRVGSARWEAHIGLGLSLEESQILAAVQS